MSIDKNNRKFYYGNCKVFSPDGKLMFLCNDFKAKWYLNKNLAIILDSDEESIKEIKLTFIPKGYGYLDNLDSEASYFFIPKENKCVCCGTTEKLTRHHIVPYCYRKYMPLEYKNHNCYDVVKLCRDCHDEYETYAQELKFKLAYDMGIDINNNREVQELGKIKRYVHALLNFFDKLPSEAFEKMYTEVSAYLGREFTHSDLIELYENVQSKMLHFYKSCPWKESVDKIEDLDAFVIMWRQHFLDYMKPKYMNDGWTVDKNIKR
jgi:hypothetical protein